jgi:hypothetical protein
VKPRKGKDLYRKRRRQIRNMKIKGLAFYEQLLSDVDRFDETRRNYYISAIDYFKSKLRR